MYSSLGESFISIWGFLYSLVSDKRKNVHLLNAENPEGATEPTKSLLFTVKNLFLDL